MGLESSDPLAKFLCFYHVIEYFYESVLKEELVSKTQSILRNPSFSVRKKSEVMKLVKMIKVETSNNKLNNNEINCLKLVINKYVDKLELLNNLDEIDLRLVNYYQNNIVNFSNGSIVDFSNDSWIDKIADRIYKTRCSLVHNNTNEYENESKFKYVYNPYKNKDELLNEIYLIKIIAEILIIKSADNI